MTGAGDTTVHLGRASQAGVGVSPGDEPTTTVRARTRRRVEPPDSPALFDLPADGPDPDGAPPTSDAAPASPVTASEALVAALLDAELFQAQLSATPRAVPVGKVEAAVRALLDANGTLAAAVVAERAGERPARFAGFAVTLQRIFNVDNYPV
nr:hypothetical protein [Micromonospora sp. DSM 115978]